VKRSVAELKALARDIDRASSRWANDSERLDDLLDAVRELVDADDAKRHEAALRDVIAALTNAVGWLNRLDMGDGELAPVREAVILARAAAHTGLGEKP
jgi:ABC-type transporter Mla subunit MlaD